MQSNTTINICIVKRCFYIDSLNNINIYNNININSCICLHVSTLRNLREVTKRNGKIKTYRINNEIRLPAGINLLEISFEKMYEYCRPAVRCLDPNDADCRIK